MVGVELFDVILIGTALLVIGRPPRFRRVGDVPPVWVWTTALLGVFVLLGVNHLYHSALGGYVGGPATHDPVVSALGITPLVLFAYCVQPAIVEELFFRYAALDTLARRDERARARWVVSAVMFGLAHIGVPPQHPDPRADRRRLRLCAGGQRTPGPAHAAALPAQPAHRPRGGQGVIGLRVGSRPTPSRNAFLCLAGGIAMGALGMIARLPAMVPLAACPLALGTCLLLVASGASMRASPRTPSTSRGPDRESPTRRCWKSVR